MQHGRAYPGEGQCSPHPPTREGGAGGTAKVARSPMRASFPRRSMCSSISFADELSDTRRAQADHAFGGKRDFSRRLARGEAGPAPRTPQAAEATREIAIDLE